ncbi:Brp/Blh family beta-carotene 15,15'-dioxygenase [Halobium salinum]|uniref:Probable beta-carotene 15,15'-dioxygenase n=1 Tax=Halobium salinum TaxID=1364940 RepID=A0ABD5PE35_9EURY|nr:Brp/Blh family beta-carotene 15,15'-dioxygenase [Halobium salinum]
MTPEHPERSETDSPLRGRNDRLREVVDATEKSDGTETTAVASDVASPSPSRAARRTVLRRTVLPVLVVLGAAALASAAGVTPPATVGYALVLVSVVVLGLPHGAVDHLVVARLAGISTRRALAAVSALYLVLGGAYLAAWYLTPAAAFAFFVLLTWLHWGLGDLYATTDLVGGAHLRSRPQRALAAAVRGALPMLVPLVAHPAEFRAVAALVVGVFAPSAAVTATVGSGLGPLSVVFDPTVRLGVAVGLGVALLVALLLGYVRAPESPWRGSWAVDAGETLLLVAFFAAVPPVLAIGLYFPLWHSLRHVLRTATLDRESTAGLERGAVTPALRRFARDAAPLTLGALLLFAGLFVVAPSPTTDLGGVLALYLVLLAVLTLPHAVVACWADLRQGVWG